MNSVSILVLMDLAHELSRNVHLTIFYCSFNPCFNGSCSRILYAPDPIFGDEIVSILVLMDLAHEYILFYFPYRKTFVSILVLMDLAHEYLLGVILKAARISFNPCFNGSCSRIASNPGGVGHEWGFNPCFNGSCSRIFIEERVKVSCLAVSILVLMDLAHELVNHVDVTAETREFQSLF